MKEERIHDGGIRSFSCRFKKDYGTFLKLLN